MESKIDQLVIKCSGGRGKQMIFLRFLHISFTLQCLEQIWNVEAEICLHVFNHFLTFLF